MIRASRVDRGRLNFLGDVFGLNIISRSQRQRFCNIRKRDEIYDSHTGSRHDGAGYEFAKKTATIDCAHVGAPSSA
jgi:hypothetical protein